MAQEAPQAGAGGPKTDAGKAAVRLNALKHGILSHEAVIRRGDLRESEDEYRTLRDQLFSELQPVGMIETMLTDKLFALYWRERRVLRVERAIVESMTIGHIMTADIERKSDKPAPTDVIHRARVWRSIYDDAEMIWALAEGNEIPLPEDLEKKAAAMGHLPELEAASSALLMKNYGLKQKMRRCQPIEHSEREAIRDLAEKLLDAVRVVLQEREREEREAEEARVEIQAIPDPVQSQRIQRYEAALHRNFLQTLHELQRVQAVRKGCAGPLPTALDVTVEAKEGFVS